MWKSEAAILASERGLTWREAARVDFAALPSKDAISVPPAATHQAKARLDATDDCQLTLLAAFRPRANLFLSSFAAFCATQSSGCVTGPGHLTTYV